MIDVDIKRVVFTYSCTKLNVINLELADCVKDLYLRPKGRKNIVVDLDELIDLQVSHDGVRVQLLQLDVRVIEEKVLGRDKTHVR